MIILEANKVPRLTDARLLQLARFARPRGLVPVRLWVKQDAVVYHGHALPNAEPPCVHVTVSAPDNFPIRDICPTRGGKSWGWVRSRTECLVAMLAHEMYHVYQAERDRDLDEGAADEYAIRQLKRWRAEHALVAWLTFL